MAGAKTGGPRQPHGELVKPETQTELRERFKQTWRQRKRETEVLLAAGVAEWNLAQRWTHIDWREFEQLRCGAWARQAGRPCRNRELWPNGRCRFHGGPSTGPKRGRQGDV